MSKHNTTHCRRRRQVIEKGKTLRDHFFAELAWAEDHLIFTPDEMRQRLINLLAEVDPTDQRAVLVLIERAKEMVRDV